MNKDLLNLIPSAEETRQTTAESEELKKRIISINKQIERAKANGRRRTCVISNGEKFEHVLKEMYSAKGYTFCPTGYCGGVWQLTTDICW